MTDAKIVFIHGLPKSIVDVIISYTPQGFVTNPVDGSLPESEQIEAVAEADFIIVYRAQPSDIVLQSAKKTKLVQLLAAGYDTMNLKLLSELKIPCSNNGGANSWAVADHTVLLMLSLYRQLIVAEKSVRRGTWNAPITGTNTFEMAGKLIGIIGMGNIGRLVAKRVLSFDAKVQYYDKFLLNNSLEPEITARSVSLDELCKTSDVISCHTPLTPDSLHLVNHDRISKMKETAMIVNTSRGPVVDEQALIEALMEGRIAGSGLDVFELEPVDQNNPLLRMDNVVITPHMAGTTWNTWFRRAEFAYANIKRVWAGDQPLAKAEIDKE